MAPLPLEGLQTPMANNVGQGPPEGNRGGMMSLAMLIDFIIQRTYHELTVLAELLPRKTDMERKIEIYNFSTRTRQLFVRLLALVKWANSASKVEKSARIMVFLDKQSLLFVETADMLARMARETLVQARLPNFHIPAAVEVLTTGTYARLPACIKERIVPPDPITAPEKKATLQRLNQIIQHRLVTGAVLPQMRDLKIENGRVTFTVRHEFEVALTVMGDGANVPWRLLEINVLVEDKETGEGKALVHPLQIEYVHRLVQARLVEHAQPLTEVYDCLHFFCQSLQLEVLYTQTLRLMRDRLDEYVHVDEYVPGRSLTVSYWRELRSELGYKLTVQVDQKHPARPLSVVHVPSVGNKESEIADRAIRSEVLSMERLLVHTIYVRTRSRLDDVKLELRATLKDVECTLQGSPAILSCAILQPCLRAEQLLITVDTHTGLLQCHVPQYDPPIIPEINAILNANRSKLPTYISELRYWITQRRCEKTLQHLPATAHERLPLLHAPDHPIARLGKHHVHIQFHRHSNVILIVEFKERETNPCEIDCSFHLCVVKRSSIEDDPKDESIETDIPKVFLKVQSVIEFDAFAATHGPFTAIDGSSDPAEHADPPTSKRKSAPYRPEMATRRSKQPAYFIAELAHVVAMCDERLPYVTLAVELSKRDVYHQGLQVEANATGLVLKIIQLPPPSGQMAASPSYRALLKRLLSAQVRVVGKNTSKSWLVELVFYSSILSSAHAKEQSPRRPVYFQYDMAEDSGKTVTSILSDWWRIVHLFGLVFELTECLKSDKYAFLTNLFAVRSYSYTKLALSYGADKGAIVQVEWRLGRFKLTFGASHHSLNAHSLIASQLEGELNESRNLAQIVQLLTETHEPLVSLSKLPGLPQLGVHNVSHKVPVQTFTIMPQSCCLIRVTYQGMYCLEVRIRGGGVVSVRDGAYSRFDKCQVLSVFFPTPGLRSFLSKYGEEGGGYRRRSQSEDDNPPSPVEVEGFLTHRPPPQSPRSETGLRFHPPLTPPSNPHTPASPHPHFGSSPAQFSPSTPSGLVPSSPLNPQLASPGGFTSSPGPPLPGHSPVGSYLQTTGLEGSPFQTSPWSPSIPRPRYLHSPQGTRVLPPRSWAGAVPTLITHDALETLCTPTPHPLGIVGGEMSPLERFLGCVYMRKQLQRYVHNESYLTNVPAQEPGAVHFRVNETLQCRVFMNVHLQSLHVKLTHDKEVFTLDELAVMERFFELRVAAPPFKPTNSFTFCSMLNSPVNVLKDFVQIMRLDLGGAALAQQQGMKWAAQWLLRIPPNAVPIVPTGTQGVMGIRNKILFFLQITRLGYPSNTEPPSIVLPLIYDVSGNITQLAEKRDIGTPPAMTAASQVLRHFCQMQAGTVECTVYPALREILMNLTFPTDAQQQGNAPPSAPGYPPHMQVNLMAPQ